MRKGRGFLAVTAVAVATAWTGGAPAAAASGWHRASPVPVGRLGLAAVADGRFVYALGGWNRRDKALASVERLDPRSGRWGAVAPMPVRLIGLAAAEGPDGRIFVFGGRGPATPDSLDSTLVYSPSNNSWMRGTPMPTPRYWAAATAGIHGTIYVIGGSNFSGRGAAGLDTVEAYTPGTDRWRSEPSLPFSDNGGYSMLAAVTGRAGRIFVLGGFDPRHGTARASVWAWWPGQSRWHARAPMPIPLFGLGAVRGAHGRIIALGGYTGNVDGRDVAGRAVESYDPARNTWRVLPALPAARALLAAAATGRGRIYAIGGTRTSTYDGLRTVQAFHP